MKKYLPESQVLPSDLVLSCRNVGVCYRKPFRFGAGSNSLKEYWPFKNLSIDLKRGETLGITGRNGVGKSTLLRLLTGVIAPDSGHILRDPNIQVQLLSVNLGFERILTGRENAVMAGMLLGKSARYMQSRVDDIKQFSELGRFFEEPVYSYSSGMVARLGFSIAIESDPDVLLLDEVLSVGDRDFRIKSKEKTKELIQSGKSVVIVSHDSDTIQSFCDRIIKLNDTTQ